jgi:hypothetical protein
MRATEFPILVLAWVLVSANAVSAQDSPRIKRKPPTSAEVERIASDTAMNDSLLRKGDIVVTDRGFFVFRGIAQDATTNEFARIPDPTAK